MRVLIDGVANFGLMNGAEISNLNDLLQAIQAIVTLAVGICSVVALMRKQPPVETDIAKLYDENKQDRAATGAAIQDHERRIAKIEGRLEK